jgi:replication fork clamp-binding protein CrfC
MSFTIESRKQEVSKKDERIFSFLSNFNHFQHLLPEDKIENWRCTDNECWFTLKGLTEMNLLIKAKQENNLIHYQSAPGSRFPVDLFLYIHPTGEKSVCQVVLTVQLSAALKLLAKKPLENFANGLVEKIESNPF